MKTALILSGGGSKGSFQFGVLKYLIERGFTPNAVYGTSVGALNAAGYGYQNIGGLEEVWNNIKGKSDILKFNWSSFILRSTGLYNTKPLRKILEKNIIGQPICDVYACKVNLLTGDIVYSKHTDSDFISSVEASASIPGIMSPVDDEWVDGGIREQTPLKQAILDGAKKIIVVLCNPWEYNPVKTKCGNWLQNSLRAVDILSHENFLSDISLCLEKNKDSEYEYIKMEIYAPLQHLNDALDFSPDKIKENIKLGYETAQLGPLKTDKNYAL